MSERSTGHADPEKDRATLTVPQSAEKKKWLTPTVSVEKFSGAKVGNAAGIDQNLTGSDLPF